MHEHFFFLDVLLGGPFMQSERSHRYEHQIAMAVLESELSGVKGIYLCIYVDKLQLNKGVLVQLIHFLWCRLT